MQRIDTRTVRLDPEEIEVHDAFGRLLDEGLSIAEAIARLDEAGSFIGRADLRAYLSS